MALTRILILIQSYTDYTPCQELFSQGYGESNLLYLNGLFELGK